MNATNQKKRWTTNQDHELIVLGLAQNHTMDELCTHFGRTHHSISKRLSRLKNIYGEEAIEQIINENAQTLKPKPMAMEWGYPIVLAAGVVGALLFTYFNA